MRVKSTLSKAQDIMRFYGTKCWLMYCDEHSDPYFARIVSAKTIVPAVGIIAEKQSFVIVHELDADNIERSEGLTVVSYLKADDLWENVVQALEAIGLPSRIHINYSTLNDAQVDVMGIGLYKSITQRVRKFYRQKQRKVSFLSAEEMIYAFFDRKGEADVARMRVAARRALELLESAFQQIKPGMSERALVDLVHSLMGQKPSYFGEEGVVKEECSWNRDICPVVLAGPSLEKGGHATPSDLEIARGYTVYFDFGVCLTFDDDSKWSSDIQRMGYILNNGEREAPEDIQRMFSTLIEAIDMGMRAIRPGMHGHEIDRIVREHIVHSGYPDYNHATGHAIGELAHNPGALLGPRDRHLSHLRIQPNGVYSMEPRISIPNGGSVEEMVLVTPDGGVPLCRPQQRLYLIE